jgi:mRNA deadenylase 3'-5' endonuclease subunit Ccr4
MGNILFVQPEDPNAYPIIERKFKKVLQNNLDSSQIDLGRVLHVMSYNILADRLALPNYFPHTTRSRLAFEFRGPRIIAEIRQSRADIICL